MVWNLKKELEEILKDADYSRCTEDELENLDSLTDVISSTLEAFEYYRDGFEDDADFSLEPLRRLANAGVITHEQFIRATDLCTQAS